MRRLFVFLFLFCATFSMAQVDLTVLPKAERDSALVAIVQGLILQKFPEIYRKDIYPVISESYANKGMEWIYDDGLSEKYYKYPDYVKSGDVCYNVQFYYKYWQEEDLRTPCITSATVIGKTGDIKNITLYHSESERLYYWWGDLMQIPDTSAAKRRLSGMSRTERDSILTDIARETVRRHWPELDRENVLPSIRVCDFSILRLGWVNEDSSIPDYVNPADIYYVVTFYYKDWKKEKGKKKFFQGAITASVYIIEKTREAYKIESGASEGDRWRYLLKPEH